MQRFYEFFTQRGVLALDASQNLHKGHRQRMKEQFVHYGAEPFSDHQLLELLLFYAIPRKDTNPLAHRLINEFHSLAGVMDASVEELMRVEGISEHSAILINLMPQMIRRYQTSLASRGTRLTSLRDIADYLKPYFFAARQEMVYLLSLDNTGRVLGCDLLSEGSINRAQLDYGKVAQTALNRRAVAVVLAHCHPLGEAEPSTADRITTEQCKRVLEMLHIQLVDHLIFADENWCSIGRIGI